MSFLAPFWLVGLLPWAAVVYWLMQRRRRPTGVPFVTLWRGPYHPPKPTRQLSRPPWAVAMLLLAMLLALLAAARPGVKDPLGRGRTPMPVIVDRGAGMSARAGARLEETFRDLQRGLLEAEVSPLRRLELHGVPEAPAKTTDVSDLTNPLPFPLTAADTNAAVSATASRLLNETSGPVIVISDRPLAVTSDRLIQVPPSPAPFRNVGIERFAARAAPQLQVMVTMAAQNWSDRIHLIISSDGTDTLTTIDAPPDGQERNVFVNVPKLGPTVEARLDVSDDTPADDRGWLLREVSSPKIEPRMALSPALQRLIESYATTRPPGEGATRVIIVGDMSEARDQPAVIVPPRRDGKSTSGEITVSPHPITRDVDFSSVGDASVVTDPPAGWTPIVRRGGDLWVAVRDAPVRQVWVGFDSLDWARTPQFVVFWANVFDWLGGGGGEATYTASIVGELGQEWTPVTTAPAQTDPKWWPGLFRRSDGAQRAVNAVVVTPGPVTQTDWRSKLSLLREVDRLEIAPYFLLAALACVLVAAAAWKVPSLTEISGKTTVMANGVLTEARAARAEATRSRLAPTDPSG
jgi:hypothetical protein